MKQNYVFTEHDKDEMETAALFIEEAKKLAEEHPEFLATTVSLQIQNLQANKFLIKMRTKRKKPFQIYAVNTVREWGFDWTVKVRFGYVLLEKKGLWDFDCKFSLFYEQVWQFLQQKHPDWHIVKTNGLSKTKKLLL